MIFERLALGRCALVLGTCLLILPALASAQEQNTINSIRTVQSGIDIELTSTKEFPVRDEVVVLRIGSQEFTQSRSPENGSLNTLIFTLTAEEFAKLGDNDDVVVYYGRGGDSGERWEFGKLNKALLDKGGR